MFLLNCPQARDGEIEDALCQIFAAGDWESYSALRSGLHAIGIAAPRDLLEQTPGTVVSLFQHRLGYGPALGVGAAAAAASSDSRGFCRRAPSEGRVREWQERARGSIAASPWLQDYVCSYLLEGGPQYEAKLRGGGAAACAHS